MAHIIARRALPNFPGRLSNGPLPRNTIHIQPLRTPLRTFHASSRQAFNPVEPIISGTSSLLEAIHVVLPWYMVLPLAAVSVRVLLLPITLSVRRIQAKQIPVTTLVHAWRHAFRRGIYKSPTAAKLSPATLTHTEFKLTKNKQKELFKLYGCQRWRNFLPMPFQFAAFMVMIEAIRGKIGTGNGLLRMLFGNKDAVIQAPEVITGAGDALEQTLVGSAPTLIQADPAMATEGMLWFTDLTAADPQLILPFMLSGAILANTLPRHILAGKPAPPPVEKSFINKMITNSTRLFALLIGPLTLSLPSGLLLYWVSSSLCMLGQTVALEWFRPLPKGTVPCKPPPNRLAEDIKVQKKESPVRDRLQARLRAIRGQ